MKELIVGGKEGIKYIIHANGQTLEVKKGDLVTFEDLDEAARAIDEIKTSYGDPLFFLYERIAKTPKKGVKKNATNTENGQQE